MAAYIALLRGINVGGQKLVSMNDVRELFTSHGLANVRTLLNSGNVVFEASGSRARRLEDELSTLVNADVFVRSAAEWESVIERNPFARQAKEDPGRLIVVALRDEPALIEELRRAVVGREVIEADGKHLYIVYPDGQGRSKLTNALIERKLETRGTARNWNTVLKLRAACATG